MAVRPVFCVNGVAPHYREENVAFQFNPGFSAVQKQKNIGNIHRAFLAEHPEMPVLEISSKSTLPIGIKLSALNLTITLGSVRTTVESAFQSAKTFENGGPYTDLLTQASIAAKKDPRLRESGALKYFVSDGIVFPLEPKTFFYDWLYLNAVVQDAALSTEICQYSAFTDIEFNPAKSINCQARSAAIFVSLFRVGKLEAALECPEKFREIVYANSISPNEEQLSFF